MASTDTPRRARALGAARSLAVLLLLVLPACGEGTGGSGPTPGPVPSGVFEVRGVLEVVPSTAPDFDALEVTCIDTNGTSSPGCIDAATAQGQEVVLLDVQGSAKYRLAPATLTAEDVTTADAIEIGLAGSSSWAVMIQLTPDGSTAFEELTSGLVGQRVAMVSDAIVVSAPIVQEPITSGAVQVGNLSQEDAQALAASLAPRS